MCHLFVLSPLCQVAAEVFKCRLVRAAVGGVNFKEGKGQSQKRFSNLFFCMKLLSDDIKTYHKKFYLHLTNTWCYQNTLDGQYGCLNYALLEIIWLLFDMHLKIHCFSWLYTWKIYGMQTLLSRGHPHVPVNIIIYFIYYLLSSLNMFPNIY